MEIYIYKDKEDKNERLTHSFATHLAVSFHASAFIQLTLLWIGMVRNMNIGLNMCTNMFVKVCCAQMR